MKDLLFVGDSHRILSGFPNPVQRHVGFALYQAQMGNKHPDAKPLKNFAGGFWKLFPIIAATHFGLSTQ